MLQSETATTDERGRIIIPAEFREKHGDRYRVVELRDRIELIPLSRDPVEGLQEAVGGAFDEIVGLERIPLGPEGSGDE